MQNDGQTGLDKGAFGDFDLVILDLMLPGVDGFEICRKVRAEKNTPIIMVSAKKMISTRSEDSDLGLMTI